MFYKPFKLVFDTIRQDIRKIPLQECTENIQGILNFYRMCPSLLCLMEKAQFLLDFLLDIFDGTDTQLIIKTHISQIYQSAN